MDTQQNGGPVTPSTPTTPAKRIGGGGGGWGKLKSASVSTPVDEPKISKAGAEEEQNEEAEEEEKKKGGAWTKFDSFCEEGELSGIKFFHSSHPSWFRFTWIFFMILFIGMMLYQLIDLILEFQENPLSIDIEYDYPESLKLPSILVCPHNQLRLTKMYENHAMDIAGLVRKLENPAASNDSDARPPIDLPAEIKKLQNQIRTGIPKTEREYKQMKLYQEREDCDTDELQTKLDNFGTHLNETAESFGEDVFFTVYTMYKTLFGKFVAINLNSSSDCSNVSLPSIDSLQLLGKLQNNTSSYQKLIEQNSFSAKEFIVNCQFQDEDPISCMKNWTEVNTIWGRCFFLNMTSINVTRSGIDYALNMEFNTQTRDQAIKKDKGMMISLIPEGGDPIMMEPIELNPGYNVHLPLRYINEEYHSSVCSEDAIEFADGEVEYTRSACMLSNFIETVKDKCGCYPMSSPNLAKQATCSIGDELGCVAKLRQNISAVWNTEKCKVACEEKRYSASLSYSTNDAARSSKIPLSDADRNEWKALVKKQTKAYFDAENKKEVKNNLPSVVDPKQIFKKRIFYGVRWVYRPLSDFVFVNTTAVLFAHGAEYLVWPLRTRRNITDLDSDAKCKIRDLTYPIPELFEQNSTAYFVANSIIALDKADAGTGKVGKLVLANTNMVQVVEYLIQVLNDTIQAKVAQNKTDLLGVQMKDRAETFVDCITREIDAGNCNASHPEGLLAWVCEPCRRELNYLAKGLNLVVAMRDKSFIMRRYSKTVDDGFADTGNFVEGIARAYQDDFLGANTGWDGFHAASELQHAVFLNENYDSWKNVWTTFRERHRQLEKWTARNMVITDPKRLDTVITSANVTVPAEYQGFFNLYECNKLYNTLWNASLQNKGISSEWLENAESLIAEARDYIDLTDIGEEFFRENVMSATIYLAEMKVKKQEQRLAYDFWTMLSDIGGTISFYIGGTIITFFEIIFWCTDIHKKKKLRLVRKKKANKAFMKIGAVSAFKASDESTGERRGASSKPSAGANASNKPSAAGNGAVKPNNFILPEVAKQNGTSPTAAPFDVEKGNSKPSPVNDLPNGNDDQKDEKPFEDAPRRVDSFVGDILSDISAANDKPETDSKPEQPKLEANKPKPNPLLSEPKKRMNPAFRAMMADLKAKEGEQEPAKEPATTTSKPLFPTTSPFTTSPQTREQNRTIDDEDDESADPTVVTSDVPKNVYNALI